MFLKFCIMFQVITFVGALYIKVWASSHICEVVTETYPKHITAIGLMILLSVLLIIPEIFYILFYVL